MYPFNDVNKGLNNMSSACIDWHLRIEQHVGPGGVRGARDGACANASRTIERRCGVTPCVCKREHGHAFVDHQHQDNG